MSNGATRRQVQRLSREQRVAEIMAAAKAVFLEHGYEEAPLSEIAERANLVEGSIYRYFDNKRDLLVKVVEDWYDSVVIDYVRQLAGIRGTQNRLRFMIWQHLKTIHEEPALSNLVIQYLRTDRDFQNTPIHDLNRRYARQTLEIIREGIEAGELRTDVRLRLISDMIYGCVEHHTRAYLRGDGDFDPDATADAIVTLVLGGMQIRQPATAPDIADGFAARIERAVHRLETLAAKSA